jgi:hypothetical protein
LRACSAQIVSSLLRRADEWLSWIETIVPTRRSGSAYSHYIWLQTMQKALSVAVQSGRDSIIHQYMQQYEHYLKPQQ